MMIVSIGVGLAARYLYLYTFGGRSRAYREYAVQEAVDIGPISLTKRDLISMAHLRASCCSPWPLFLQRSRQGKAIRAVSDNPELASATGINTNRVILLVWVAGGALAGLGGVLLGLDEQVRWNMGFTLPAADVRRHHGRRARQPVRRPRRRAAHRPHRRAVDVDLPGRRRAEERPAR